MLLDHLALPRAIATLVFCAATSPIMVTSINPISSKRTRGIGNGEECVACMDTEKTWQSLSVLTPRPKPSWKIPGRKTISFASTSLKGARAYLLMSLVDRFGPCVARIGFVKLLAAFPGQLLHLK